MLKNLLTFKWTYVGWGCCKCGETNQKATCWACGHERCHDCQDGW